MTGGGDLRDLYQEVVLEHSKRPRNYREMPDATATAQGFNPLCGDQLTLYLKVQGRGGEGGQLRGPGLRDLQGLRVAAHRGG